MAEWWRTSSLVFTAVCICPLEIYPFLSFHKFCSLTPGMGLQNQVGHTCILGGGAFEWVHQLKTIFLQSEAFGNYRITNLFPGISFRGLESYRVEDGSSGQMQGHIPAIPAAGRPLRMLRQEATHWEVGSLLEPMYKKTGRSRRRHTQVPHRPDAHCNAVFMQVKAHCFRRHVDFSKKFSLIF